MLTLSIGCLLWVLDLVFEKCVYTFAITFVQHQHWDEAAPVLGFSQIPWHSPQHICLFSLLPTQLYVLWGPDADVTRCYLIATEVRQSKAVIMLRIKVIHGSLDASRIGFTSYMGTHSNPEGLTGLTGLFPFINPYSPVARKGGSLTKHYT